MHIKETLFKDGILSTIEFLYQKIEEVNRYPDKSLFFQDPQIIEAWLQLVRVIKDIKFWKLPEGAEEWAKRTETYTGNLLSLRDIHQKYKNLYEAYYKQMDTLLKGYCGWLAGDCVNLDSLDALLEDQYEKEMAEVNDLTQFLEKLNSKSLNARNDVYMTLLDISKVIMTIMNRGAMIVMNQNPSVEDFAMAISDDLREWTLSFGKSMFEDMKEDLTRHYKAYRTAPYTPELWGEMLNADEEALLMASKQQLSKCDAVRQEHWGEDMKRQMDEHGDLMRIIYSSCRTEKLFDLINVENVQKFIDSLTSDNLSMFYEIIVRRNLIQCEMYSELKAQHDVWLNPTKNDKTENHEIPQTQVNGEEGVDNKEPAEEERFHFIHVEIEDEEAWRIHHAIKRLVANYRIPDICAYLKEQKNNGKLMLPSNPSNMYTELVRLGMPSGEGFSEKNFSNIYNSYTK